MKSINSKRDGIIFSLKYFGLPNAILWLVLMWDLTDAVAWRLFVFVLGLFAAVPWALFMWWAIWSRPPSKCGDQ
jgi:hypothetical protein